MAEIGEVSPEDSLPLLLDVANIVSAGRACPDMTYEAYKIVLGLIVNVFLEQAAGQAI